MTAGRPARRVCGAWTWKNIAGKVMVERDLKRL
jgi:hypothetical protein